MKKAIIIGAAFFCTAVAAHSDPILGSWAIEPNDPSEVVQVKVTGCGSSFCGTYERIPTGETGVGERMFWDMQAAGNGRYTGGKILTLDNGRTYSGKLELKGKELKISGCLVGGTMCRGAFFERVK